MRFIVLVLTAMLWAPSLYAQSVPNGGSITPGQVWTPAQWMNGWQSKVDTTNGVLNSPTINGATLGTSSTIVGGSLSGTVTTNGVSTATGGTSSRSVADWQADAVNILGMGVGGTPVDRTGSTDASGAIQAAITLACGLSPIKSVYVPFGIYKISSRLTVPGGCNGLTIRSDIGAIWRLDPASTANSAILSLKVGSDHSLLSNVTIQNLTFDGSVATTTNKNNLVAFTWPTDSFSCLNCTFQNSLGSALVTAGEQPLSGNLNAQANPGQPVLSFASVPANVGVGSLVVGSACLDPDMYVISTISTTVTLNRNITDTCLSGTQIQFTRSFTTSADALYGATSFSTSSTSGLSVGETIWIPANPTCLQENTRIVSLVSNSSITVDKPIQCKIISGTNFSAAGGHSNLTISNSFFYAIGQPNLTGASTNFTANGTSSPGNTIVLNCVTGNCSKATVLPGQKTGSSPPVGIPPNDMVTDVSVNTGAGTATIKLQSPLTGTVLNGTSIPFATSAGGIGYGIWHSWGAPFANGGDKYIGNRFLHTWSAPMFMISTGNALFQGNTCIEDQMEYRDASIAPSPCLNLESSVGAVVNGEVYSGASGAGIEAEHAIRLKIIQADLSRNAGAGAVILGGHDNEVLGLIANNNCQYVNSSYIQDYNSIFSACSGLNIGGSATTSQTGTATNVNVSGVIASDTQNTPTQKYGVRFVGAGSLFTNLNIGSFNGTGNTIALLDPLLGPQVTACGTSPSISTNATDSAGLITLGTTATGCTVTFASAKSLPPVCQITPWNAASTAALLSSSVSTTAISLSTLTASGLAYSYQCH